MDLKDAILDHISKEGIFWYLPAGSGSDYNPSWCDEANQAIDELEQMGLIESYLDFCKGQESYVNSHFAYIAPGNPENVQWKFFGTYWKLVPCKDSTNDAVR